MEVMYGRHAIDTAKLVTALKSAGILPETLNIYMSWDSATKIELTGVYEGQSETEKVE